jgi:hypothetical protein
MAELTAWSVSGTGAAAWLAAVLQEARLPATITTTGTPRKRFHIMGAYLHIEFLDKSFFTA